VQDHRVVRLEVTEESWRSTFGAANVAELRSALERTTGDGTLASSPLARGLEPYPDNWRAGVRQRPDTLPHGAEHLAAFRRQVRLCHREAASFQPARAHRIGLLGHAGQAGQVACSNAGWIEHTQGVGADGE
jgi:hypothetical protein